MNRRELITGGAAVAAASVIPSLPAAAGPTILKAKIIEPGSALSVEWVSTKVFKVRMALLYNSHPDGTCDPLAFVEVE